MIKKLCAPLSGVMRRFGRLKKIFQIRLTSDNYIRITSDGFIKIRRK